LFVDSSITLTGGDRLISPLDLGSSVASASNSVRKPEQISFLVQYLNAGGMNTKISDFFESTGGSQSDVIMFHPWKLLIIAFTTSTERTETLLILASCVMVAFCC
jgi:hypothetical protein